MLRASYLLRNAKDGKQKYNTKGFPKFKGKVWGQTLPQIVLTRIPRTFLEEPVKSDAHIDAGHGVHKCSSLAEGGRSEKTRRDWSGRESMCGVLGLPSALP